uniref:Ovule protein n=1 Tax=Heterorhabditis bacteriophora TaxID=37862 RepID=A0A1I7WQT3_HETBA
MRQRFTPIFKFLNLPLGSRRSKIRTQFIFPCSNFNCYLIKATFSSSYASLLCFQKQYISEVFIGIRDSPCLWKLSYRSIRTYNSRCVKLLVDRNHQTPDDESDISEEL